MYAPKNQAGKDVTLFRLESEGFMDIVSTSGELRYKVGVIDFLTRYSTAKLVENRLKSTLHRVDSNAVSAIDPSAYS